LPEQIDGVRVLQPSARLIDPHVWTDSPDRLSIRLSIYESLVRYDEKYSDYVPALANRWTVDSSARIWTLELRRDVVFHNGDRFEAEDVVAALNRARDPDMGGELGTQGLFERYLGDALVSPTSKHQLRIVTAEPMADLLDLLVEIPILPRRASSDMTEADAGTGPFQLTERGSNGILLEAFDRYWGDRPTTRTVRWVAEPSRERRVRAILTGEADVVTSLVPEDVEEIGSVDGLKTTISDSSVCAVFMCNLFSGVCTSKAVRQALNYALDVDELIARVMGGSGTALNGPLTRYHLGHDPATVPYSFDPEVARSRLVKAGFEDGMALTLDVPQIVPDRAPALAREMAQQYARVGIETTVREFSDRPAYASMVSAKEIDDACCFDSSPLSTYRVLREKFHSREHGPWWLGYENRRVDELLDQASQCTVTERRRRLYQEAYRLIRDDAPWIFLLSPQYMWASRASIPDLTVGVDGVLRFGTR